MRSAASVLLVLSSCAVPPPESVGEYCTTVMPLYCDREIYCLRAEGFLLDEETFRPTCEAVFYSWCCDDADDCSRPVRIDNASLWERCLLTWADRECEFVLGDRNQLTPPVCERL